MARPNQKNPTRAGPPQNRTAAVALLALALFAVLVAYAPARNMPFFFDDRVTILQNPLIQSPYAKNWLSENPFRAAANLTFALQLKWNSPKALPPNAYDYKAASKYISEGFSEEYQRHLSYYRDPVTFESIPVSVDPVRKLFFPLPSAAPFHRFNLAIHIMSAAALFFISLRLRPGGSITAALAAAIFLLHPLATEPVNYATARFTLMAGMFSLLAVLAHLYADKRPWLDIVSALFFLLALFSKETAATLPLMVFLLDAARGRPRFRVLFGLVASAIYTYVRIFHWMVVPAGSGGDLLPWYKYLVVEQRVIWSYVIKTLAPLNLNFDPHVIPAAGCDLLFTCLNALLLAGSGYLVIKWVMEIRSGQADARSSGQKSGKGKKDMAGKDPDPAALIVGAPVLVWAGSLVLIAWISVAPTSSVIALSDLAKEDRAYTLLMIIVPALIAGLGPGLLAAPGIKRPAAALCMAAIVLCAGALCFARNRDWSGEVSLTRDMMLKSPQKPRAVYQYATALKWRGQIERALFWYQRALELDPQNADAIINVRQLKIFLEKQSSPRLHNP